MDLVCGTCFRGWVDARNVVAPSLGQRENQLRERARVDVELARMEKLARQRLADLTSSIQTGPLEARKALETLVAGPLQFTPVQTTEGKRYRITGELALESMFAGESEVLGGVPLASPAGQIRDLAGSSGPPDGAAKGSAGVLLCNVAELNPSFRLRRPRRTTASPPASAR